VQGEVVNPLNPRAVVHFHPRCPLANARCRSQRPALSAVQGVLVACHAVEEGVCRPADYLTAVFTADSWAAFSRSRSNQAWSPDTITSAAGHVCCSFAGHAHAISACESTAIRSAGVHGPAIVSCPSQSPDSHTGPTTSQVLGDSRVLYRARCPSTLDTKPDAQVVHRCINDAEILLSPGFRKSTSPIRRLRLRPASARASNKDLAMAMAARVNASQQ